MVTTGTSLKSKSRRCLPAVYAAGLLGGMLLLQGCGEVKNALGQTKRPPDEFAVVARPPLSVPPEYRLRPPSPGAVRPQEQSVTEGAEKLVFKGAGTRTAGAAPFGTAPVPQSAPREAVTRIDPVEAQFRKRLCVDEADPSIREVIAREGDQYEIQGGYPIDKLLFWRKPPPAGVVVDAEAEKKRLQENAALGKPVTDGVTPTIRRKRGSNFEGLF